MTPDFKPPQMFHYADPGMRLFAPLQGSDWDAFVGADTGTRIFYTKDFAYLHQPEDERMEAYHLETMGSWFACPDSTEWESYE